MSYDLGGGGGSSFPYENPGDSVTGTIVGVDEVQQTDLTTNALAYWPDGKPKMQFRVTLQTTLRDDADDDGLRTVYLRGSRKPESKSSLAAVLGAVKAATGSQALDDGATLTLTYTGDGVASQRGFNPPKQYEAVYVPPAPGSTSLGNGQQQPVQQSLPIQQQPAYQQQAPPQYAPQQPVQQQPQVLQPAPPAGPGAAGFLNGSPIMPAQYAGMVAAGVVPEQLQGWVPA